jgi:hypothetical protein
MDPEDNTPEFIQKIDKLGDKIAELSGQIHAATYRLLMLIREFEDKSGWYQQGARSCAHWLSWRCGIALGAAREKVRVAHALKNLPLISDAFRTAKISYSKARALTRVAEPDTEKKLLNIALHGTTSHVEKVVRAWRKIDAQEERNKANRQHVRRYLQTYTDEDGTLVLRGRLAPEVGAVVQRAIEAAMDKLHEKDSETDHRQRKADALGLVAEAALNNGLDPGTRGDRYQVVVHVDEPVLEDPESAGQSVLEDGQNVSAETSRRLACDASKVVMKHAEDGSVLDLGRKTRIVSAALRRVLEYRDQTCRFPGCSSKYCQAHHLEHWANGGETKIENLASFCWHHHRAVHEGGFRVERLPNGEFRFYNPGGRLVPDVPESPIMVDDPITLLTTCHKEEGIDIDERTCTPHWDGEPMDLDYVMMSLRN